MTRSASFCGAGGRIGAGSFTLSRKLGIDEHFKELEGELAAVTVENVRQLEAAKELARHYVPLRNSQF